MASNVSYSGPADMPASLPVFPLAGALLLPRGEMPLNVFEPRYVAMIDDALKGDRLIGMIQPSGEAEREGAAPPIYRVGCAGRITQIAESGDGRYLLTLTGIARFTVAEELPVLTPYRQVAADWTAFVQDYEPRHGEADVDRDAVVKALRGFARANKVPIDWDSVKQAPTEALVNALAMMSPYGAREKQAMLEAAFLKDRAEMLVAITEMELARGSGGPDTTLQ
jgi:hypothetical protein